ncbi:putative xyloglucan endotransglucosylase/hydrolase protein 23 [Hibiscus syriacus]|uniref:Xyloglucan endotransglucosylase/hydrolase protein 23 n=1 Tax=Hibiscus syriacus TaxID=106335 RepID=A0A6A2WAU0_HIBSY|nr:putative xyloglucan endotransglucosylase/hydrolase protein 23 [Hibiscus syriacus]
MPNSLHSHSQLGKVASRAMLFDRDLKYPSKPARLESCSLSLSFFLLIQPIPISSCFVRPSLYLIEQKSFSLILRKSSLSFRGKIGQTKLKRYWPGKAPEWADDANEDGDIRMAMSAALEKAFPSHEDPSIVLKDDSRLRRLAESRVDNRDEIRADHRRIRQAEIVSMKEEENRRNEREEEEEEVEEEEEEEEEEYETDSEEEHMGIAMAKAVFVPKSDRETIAERKRLEAEEQAMEEAEKRKLEHRKIETRQLVVENIWKNAEIQKNMELEANLEDVDTDDEINEAEDYEAWKAREIARIKRDREEREAMIREREKIEKVRNMTEEERREWERRNPKPAPPPKQKWKFMQKYYHKGAFFQTDADDPAATAGAHNIYHRDFSAPTGDDKMDKTILPKVMQVKHFGRSGRTKWTHLVNEDTTDWNNPWTYNDPLRAKYNAKMAAVNAPIAKPKGSKKLKDWETK